MRLGRGGAGVYIYKVEVDGWVEAKKTTKLPSGKNYYK